jgi:hypothetical protein
MWHLDAEQYALIWMTALWVGWLVYYARLSWRAAESASGGVARFVFPVVLFFHRLWPHELQQERRRAYRLLIAWLGVALVLHAAGITHAT